MYQVWKILIPIIVIKIMTINGITAVIVKYGGNVQKELHNAQKMLLLFFSCEFLSRVIVHHITIHTPWKSETAQKFKEKYKI